MSVLIPGYKKKYTGESKKINLGKSKKKGKGIYFKLRIYGVTPIIGRARSGKTNIVKVVLAQATRMGRRIIIFDPYRDYYDINRLNPQSDEPTSVPNVKKISHFTFPISSFQEIDYLTLGFPEVGASIMAQLGIEHRDKHKDDPDEFFSLLENIPSNWDDVYPFQEEYGIKTQPVFPATKKSILKRFELMRDDMIYDPLGETPYLDGDVIRESIEGHNVIFDLNMFLGREMRMRTYVGMILREIRPTLGKLKPLIVLEEFDKLCPIDQFTLSSYLEIKDYAIKLQRQGVHILAISQNEQLINPSVMENWHQKIQGKVAYKNEISEKLKFYEDFNVRYFAVVDMNNNVYIFNPPLTPCGH